MGSYKYVTKMNILCCQFPLIFKSEESFQTYVPNFNIMYFNNTMSLCIHFYYKQILSLCHLSNFKEFKNIEHLITFSFSEAFIINFQTCFFFRFLRTYKSHVREHKAFKLIKAA